MLAIFSCPKPFTGHFKTIQRNAIQSWLALKPRPEILLIGDEEMAHETCAEFKIHHVPSVKRNSFGTPLMSSIFATALEHLQSQYFCYVNADIILLPEFIGRVERIKEQFEEFLAVGRRTTVDIQKELDFKGDWVAQVRHLKEENGFLEHHSAIDCFVFKRSLVQQFPDFALGRPMWDNYFLYSTQKKKIPLIDFTSQVDVIHQKHDYSHYTMPGNSWDGPEAKANLKLAGGYRNAYTIGDCDYQLSANSLNHNYSKYYFKSIRTLKSLYGRFIKHDERW